ncbi:Hypothetical predicted protein [Pelobates cultripes]|uniref:Lebercilin domain-containing protein n=1 Tax=Pelobates cultripes TaxID=61616 RepID=A0AAD1RD28_PELCU|nr:Hypothetical predicted protein [Pelobates cultripes]
MLQDLEKNIELTQSSFQRQLQSERKKAYDAQEDNKMLKEELQKMTLKLKEKEKELDIKNIYAYRLSKPSPRKITEVTPRRKVMSHSISPRGSGIKSADEEFSPTPPLPPPPPLLIDEVEENQQAALNMEQNNLEKQLREEASELKREKELAERRRQQEDRQRKEQERKMLEDKARILREEWEKEESERRRKDLDHQSKLEKEEHINTTEEERHKKELLLAKLFEIDKENQDTFHSDLHKSPPQTPPDSYLNLDTTKTKHKMYTFSEPTQKLFNGVPVHDSRDVSSNTEASTRRNKNIDSSVDLTFGNYTPSFGKGRSVALDQKDQKVLEDPVIISNTKLNIQKDKKSNLLEQLFGSSSTTALPSIPKASDSSGFAAGNAKIDQGSQNTFPWERNIKEKDYPFIASGGKSINSNRHSSQPTVGKPLIKPIDFSEDDIEEVVL